MIGKLADQAGVHIEAIRSYERRGLLPEPPRTPLGYRLFGLKTHANRRMKMTEFACNLLALNAAERHRHQAVLQEMQSSLQSVQELPDGYALAFPPHPTLLMLLAEFISRERRCCPFFTFELRIEAEGGPFWLKMTGEEGIKPFLQAEMNLSTLMHAKHLR